MYVNTVSRSLGAAGTNASRVTQQSGGASPSAARLAEMLKACGKQWTAYKKKNRKLPYAWRAFLAANPTCRAGVAVRWGWQPPADPCGDAQSGLLIDCWNAALQKGVNLNGMGDMLTQAQLTAAFATLRRTAACKTKTFAHTDRLHLQRENDGAQHHAGFDGTRASRPTWTG